MNVIIKSINSNIINLKNDIEKYKLDFDTTNMMINQIDQSNKENECRIIEIMEIKLDKSKKCKE